MYKVDDAERPTKRTLADRQVKMAYGSEIFVTTLKFGQKKRGDLSRKGL